MKLKNKALYESIKALAERIAPEAAEDSKKLLKILDRHWRWNSPEELDADEQELLKKYDLKYDKSEHDIYPNELDTSDRESYKRRRYGISAEDRFNGSKKDLTQLGRKRLQRDKAGSSNKRHGYGRTSDEQKRLKKAVDDAESDLAFYKNNNWENDAKSAERSLKIRQGKLDKENKTLRDERKRYSYQNQERKADIERISQNVSDYKSSKRGLKWADSRDKDFAKDREEETRRFIDRIKEIDDRVARNNEERQWHKDRINRLLRRKTENLNDVSKEDVGTTEKPVYADAVRRFKETDKLRKEHTKVQETPKHDEKAKNPKMTSAAKKMKLDEKLFEGFYDFDEEEHEEGICPECGTPVEYSNGDDHLVIADTETAYYSCKCPGCGKKFKEWHEIQLNFSHYEEANLNEKLLVETGEWEDDEEGLLWKQQLLDLIHKYTTFDNVTMEDVVGFDKYQGPFVYDSGLEFWLNNENEDCLLMHDTNYSVNAPAWYNICSKEDFENFEKGNLMPLKENFNDYDGEKLTPDEFDELYATLDTDERIAELYYENCSADTLDDFYNAVEAEFPTVEFYGYDWKESDKAKAKYEELVAAGYRVTLDPSYEGTDAYGLIAIK